MLGLLLAAGAVLAALPPERGDAVAARLRGSVLAPFLRAHEAVRERARMARRLNALREERDSLARDLVRLRESAMENRRLRDLLSLQDWRPDSVLAAELRPARVRRGGARTFVLPLGERGPVPVPTGVFTARGLVGVVRSITGDTGVGDFWTHPDFRVSVRTEDGTATGIVRAVHVGGRPGMIFEGAPYQTEIPEGTGLVTSGLGGIYPPGVPVGTVREVSAVESGWARSYRVEPAVRPGAVDVAMVWLRASGVS